HMHSLSSVVFMLRPPPRSPLFPFTTLFRSRGAGAGRHLGGGRGAHHRRIRSARPRRSAHADQRIHGPALRRAIPRRWTVLLRERDRKSTRLNSSHLVISYAVFCLKKKKKPK